VLVYLRRGGGVRAVDVDTGAAVRGARLGNEKTIVVGPGTELAGAVGSPDGRWLAAGWPEADQLVFVSTDGPPAIQAVSNISAQFRSRSFPTIEGWSSAR
jgi:hypothetical protein